MQLSFGPMLHSFTFLQLLAMVVEVGVDLETVVAGVGRVVVVGRRKGGRWQHCHHWWWWWFDNVAC